ncbi:Sec-independent protein translocase protein TatB [Psychromonas sp. Urea-02u-13]|uniref:Sec-independent protein translocase protein TatB n=1 Tax=Psychromonas sp. Urea-02u-13 TaxID=2058326 RepID=UPI000C32F1B7|nr:Sec-independent protein translocase protein TatB [Psychromonas sp. Urea-02u-13]PKG38091.1 twin-arginine translocase subunit TatB [Psychromonas sp. Urea-02u-13]
MFDIGFWEIALISIIGLVVLGPERLPTAIRSVMQWINTAKGMANSVKSEISQELKLHEMNENMIKATKAGLDSLDPDLQKSIDEMKQSAQELVNPYKSEVDEPQQTQTIKPPEKVMDSVQQQEQIDERK